MDLVKVLRDNYDVAHYKTNSSAIGKVENHYGFAADVVIKVIKYYREFLKNSKTIG
jgi:hypothetical protein